MTTHNGSKRPHAKRRKLDSTAVGETSTYTTLSRPVSPPVTRRKPPVSTPVSVSPALLVPAPTWGFDDVAKQTPPSSQHRPTNQSTASSRDINEQEKVDELSGGNVRRVSSPFLLTKIRDVALDHNVDTVELKDLLGSPMIKECWNFNFLFDLDFVM